MSILADAQLLGKKFVVSVIIYIIPVTILVGGLLLTKKLLEKNSSTTTQVAKSSPFKNSVSSHQR
jgi:hypothetical protein